MHRLGFEPEQVAGVRQQLSRLDSIQVCGLLTHFACADDVENPAFSELSKVDPLSTAPFLQAVVNKRSVMQV